MLLPRGRRRASGNVPGGRRTLAAAGLALAVTVLPASGATAATSAPGADVDRVVRDGRIVESSGLAASLHRPGVLWTHNDSGHPGQLFALGPDGRTVAVVLVDGAPARDWEAVATYRDRSGRPMIVVADIGDGQAAREWIALVVLPEPPLRDASVRPERVIRLTYPSGPRDAEAILVDPDGGRAFIVTKGIGGTIFQVPPKAWQGSGSPTATLVERTGVPLILVTDGVMGPAGHPVLRTYGELAVLPPIEEDLAGGTAQPLATLRLPAQQQGESLALRGTRTVLVGSEGERQPVLRVSLPPAAQEALAGTEPAATGPAGADPSAGPSDVTGPSDEAGAFVVGSRLHRVLVLLTLGAAGLLVAGVILLSIRSLRRRRG